MRADIIVIGAGTVGSAIAYGLAGRGQTVLVLDGSDTDHRAARANFGLVWVQGKGMTMPAYQNLSIASTDLWPEFARELVEETGIELEYEKRGGFAFCLGEDAFEARRKALTQLREGRGANDGDFDMVERPELERAMPRVTFGPAVTGASFGRHDGHVNPLRLLSALQAGLVRRGAALLRGHPVERVTPTGSGFDVVASGRTFSAPRIVLAAGLGSAALAGQVGLDVPIRPERGQLLVTERVEPFFPYPASGIRQTSDGTLLLGVTKEEVGFDARVDGATAGLLGRKALQFVPALASLRIVRHWAGLRIMTPDSFPVYAESPACPGAFATTCHSGVTLAGYHATILADALARGELPPGLEVFHPRRFDVPKAA